LKILVEYLLQDKKKPSLLEKLRVADDISDDKVDALFIRHKDIT